MRASLPIVCALLALAACDDEPAEASVTNEIPGASIEKVWFRTTLFEGPLEPGHTSATLRVGVGAEPAYAVVRIGAHAFVARTNDPIDASEGGETRIVFSPATARSVCFGAPPIAEEERAFIETRIFPGDQVSDRVEDCGQR